MERPDRGGADGSDVSTSASDEEEDSEEEGGEGRPARRSKLHRTALDILEGGGDEAGAEAGGLLALPFMKRAREKQRAAALQAAERVLAEEEGRKAEGRARTSGRLQFSGDGGAAAASVRPVAAIAAGEDSDLESDEDEDVEAKAARLARHLSAERREEGVAQAAAEAADVREPATVQGRAGGGGGDPPAAGSAQPRQHSSAGFVAVAAGAGRASTRPAVERDDLFAPSTSAAAKTFLPSGSFAGARKGYTFKKGPQGVGYYIDAAGEVPAPKAKGQVQQKRQQGQQTGPTKKARSGDAGRAAQEAELGDDSLKPAEVRSAGRAGVSGGLSEESTWHCWTRSPTPSSPASYVDCRARPPTPRTTSSAWPLPTMTWRRSLPRKRPRRWRPSCLKWKESGPCPAGATGRGPSASPRGWLPPDARQNSEWASGWVGVFALGLRPKRVPVPGPGFKIQRQGRGLRELSPGLHSLSSSTPQPQPSTPELQAARRGGGRAQGRQDAVRHPLRALGQGGGQVPHRHAALSLRLQGDLRARTPPTPGQGVQHRRLLPRSHAPRRGQGRGRRHRATAVHARRGGCGGRGA